MKFLTRNQIVAKLHSSWILKFQKKSSFVILRFKKNWILTDFNSLFLLSLSSNHQSTKSHSIGHLPLLVFLIPIQLQTKRKNSQSSDQLKPAHSETIPLEICDYAKHGPSMLNSRPTWSLKSSKQAAYLDTDVGFCGHSLRRSAYKNNPYRISELDCDMIASGLELSMLYIIKDFIT